MTAYELYQELDSGRATLFTYNGEVFHVRKVLIHFKTEITDKFGNVATCEFYFNCLLDYQGIACNLQQDRRHQKYDKKGNLYANN